jgi:hypothetical protein
MIRTLRSYFLTRLLREKILLLGFILIGVLWWGSAFSTRAAGFWREQRTTTATLAEQQVWLDNRVVIENAARKAASQLEASKTLDRTRLLSAVNQAAYEAGLRNNYSGNPAASQDASGQFTVHSIDFAVNNADYETLEKFYLNLHQRAPYIGIERFTLSANRNDQSKLTLNLQVSSVELPR